MIIRIVVLFFAVIQCAMAQWNSWSNASTVRDNLLRAQKEGKSYFSQFHVYDARSKKNHFSSRFKDMTGEDLLIYGLDFYYASGTYFDSTYKAENRRRIVEIVKKMWKENRAIPSFSWHLENPYVPSDFPEYMGCRFRSSSKVPDYPSEHRYVIREILDGTGGVSGFGRYHAADDFSEIYETPAKWFDARAREVASIINDFIDENGKPIPFLFRLWHEQEDEWMWWGKSSVSKEDYKKFFVLTEQRIKLYAPDAQILWGYGPDRYWKTKEEFMSWYPGDEFVDIIGYDDYSIGSTDVNFEQIQKRARIVFREAEKRNKIAALFESDNKNPTTSEFFFSDRLLKLLKSEDVRLGLVQLWSTCDISTKTQKNDRMNFLRSDKIVIKRVGK